MASVTEELNFQFYLLCITLYSNSNSHVWLVRCLLYWTVLGYVLLHFPSHPLPSLNQSHLLLFHILTLCDFRVSQELPAARVNRFFILTCLWHVEWLKVPSDTLFTTLFFPDLLHPSPLLPPVLLNIRKCWCSLRSVPGMLPPQLRPLPTK